MAGKFAHTKTQSHKDMFATRSEILGRNQLGGRRDPHREPPILQNRQFCGKGCSAPVTWRHSQIWLAQRAKATQTRDLGDDEIVIQGRVGLGLLHVSTQDRCCNTRHRSS
jgi:hypothetical protein